MRILKVGAILFMFLLLYACTPEAKEPRPNPVTPGTTIKSVEKAAWEIEWANAVSEAKKEGKVFIYSTDIARVRTALSNSLREKYNINLEFTPGRAAELLTKVLAEKRAALNIADAWMGAVDTANRGLKPEGFLADLKSELLLPEVRDPNVWFERKMIFRDPEGKYIVMPMATVEPPTTLINTDLVKEGEITSYHDLLNPRWKGRIGMDDVIRGTLATARMVTRPIFLKNLDWDYWRALVKQEPALIDNERLQVETVARGKYAVVLGADYDLAKDFVALGAPIKSVYLKEDARLIIRSAGSLSFLSNSSHPNARKVFLNWYLSREGQTVFSRALNAPSARVDIPTDHLQGVNIPDPKVNYFNMYSAEFERFEVELGKSGIVKEVFDPLLR